MIGSSPDKGVQRKATVYCSHSERSADSTEDVTKFVTKKNKIAVNPFKVLKQFKLEDLSPLIMKCDELWLFGENEQAMDSKMSYEVKEWKKLKGIKNIRFVSWKDAGIQKQ